MSTRRKATAAASVLLVAAVFGVGMRLAGGRDAAQSGASERAAAGVDTPSPVPGVSRCSPPYVCTATDAMAIAVKALRAVTDRPVVESVIRKTRMAEALALMRASMPDTEDAVAWVVAIRTEPSIEAPDEAYPGDGYPGPSDALGGLGSEGLVVVIEASGQRRIMQQYGLADDSAHGVRYSDVEAMEDMASLVVSPPSPVATVTPTERCGPFVLCTPRGAIAAAKGSLNEMHENSVQELDFDHAVARLVPWAIVVERLGSQPVNGNSEGPLGCGFLLPEQVVWAVAVPLRTPPGSEPTPRMPRRSGLLILLSPADSQHWLAVETLLVGAPQELSLDLVEGWLSQPVPSDLHDAVPGCKG